METPTIDKNYHLGDKEERTDFYTNYSQYIESLMSLEQCDEILDSLFESLGEEWTTVYSLGEISVKVAQKKSIGMNFFETVLPFGRALLELKNLDGFERLVQKLNVPSFEKESTILEVKSAARYSRAGYEIVLEPILESGKHSDFKVKYDDEWIFFECKKENVGASKYYTQYQDYVNKIMDDVLDACGTRINEEYRIDLVFTRKLPKRHLPELLEKIKQCFDDSNFNTWVEMNGLKLAVNSREVEVSREGPHIRASRFIVPTEPTRISHENAHIQVIYNPFGNKELQKIRRILNAAKKQLPKDHRGVIILEVNHTEKMVDVVLKKMSQRGFEHVIATMLTGNGAWSIPSPVHHAFPLDFLQIAVLP